MNRLPTMIVISIFSLALTMSAQTQKTQNHAPDNTQVNQRDSNHPTADQQKGRSDDEITRQIRRSITKDKAMSTYAKNVKVVTQNGNVTLRGPVRTDEEKRSVEEKANDVAGRDHVKSEIQIAPQDTKRKQ